MKRFRADFFASGCRSAALTLAVAVAPAAYAGAIPFDTFLEFGFAAAGVPATGCDPADPAGPFCIPSSGTPTSFLDAPPWTFVAPAGGATLTVTDAFEAGDRFEIFDFAASIGLTSVPVGTVDCGDDPAVCLANPAISSGSFSLASGNHSLVVVPTVAPSGSGSGFLRVQAQAQAVPEPGALALLGIGLAGLGLRRKMA